MLFYNLLSASHSKESPMKSRSDTNRQLHSQTPTEASTSRGDTGPHGSAHSSHITHEIPKANQEKPPVKWGNSTAYEQVKGCRSLHHSAVQEGAFPFHALN